MKPKTDLEYRNLSGNSYTHPEKSPFIHGALVERGQRMMLSVDFRIDGRHAFLPRLKLAFRYWWLIASGKLEYAILAKVKQRQR